MTWMLVLKIDCLDVAKNEFLELIGIAKHKQFNPNVNRKELNLNMMAYQIEQMTEKEFSDLMLESDKVDNKLAQDRMLKIHSDLVKCNRVKNWDAGI